MVTYLCLIIFNNMIYLRVKKVLIVEDDFFIRKLYDEAFASAGYEVSTTDNGELAVSLLEKEPYSVILLDMMLPDMSGVDILKKIRSTQNHNTQTPVFILTNNDDKVVIDEVVSAGANEYLLKANYQPKDIVAEVEAYLSSHSIS